MPTPTLAARIDARDIAPGQRQPIILAAYRDLKLGDALEIIDDQDPTALYHHFRVEAPGDFSWVYLNSEPEVWRVCVQKLGRAHSAGDCCGVCASDV